MAAQNIDVRMKSYESVSKNYLMSKTPVIIRLDGRAFHKYTECCDKPFDNDLNYLRKLTMKELCNSIDNCVMAYAQSDEISLLLKDWHSIKTEYWFNYNVQKLSSITASMCTAYWNSLALKGKKLKFVSSATFDSRAFNLPMEEVNNYFVWRQQDWERNSVNMLARSFYTHDEIKGIKIKDLVTKVEREKGVVWGSLENWKKQGNIYIKGFGFMDNHIFKMNSFLVNNLLYEQETK